MSKPKLVPTMKIGATFVCTTVDMLDVLLLDLKKLAHNLKRGKAK